MKRHVITALEELDRLEAKVVGSVETTRNELLRLLAAPDALASFAKLKFTAVGRDPLDVDRPLNLIEQLNQTFTYLAGIAGARWLISRHTDCLPLVLNLGTASGFDIASQCGRFVAETFAATHPRSNDKLRRDAFRLQRVEAQHRFVFYLSMVGGSPFECPGVTIVRLEHPLMNALN